MVAETRAAAEDGVAAVLVDYEPLQPVPNAEAAVEFSAPLLHPRSRRQPGRHLRGHASAIPTRHSPRPTASSRAASTSSATRACRSRRAASPRSGTPGASTSPCGRRRSGRTPCASRSRCCWACPSSAIRVIAPDVGGGFGVKQDVYPEEVVLALLARRLGRPVKWIETRREHLLHRRPRPRAVARACELAVRNDGTILGMRADVLSDQGAYTRSLGLLCPSLTAAGLPGPYRFHAYHCRVRVALTNKAPAAAYRGAGQPEAVFATERIVDRVAQELGLDPAEVRRKNFIRPDEFPWDVGTESAQTPGRLRQRRLRRADWIARSSCPSTRAWRADPARRARARRQRPPARRRPGGVRDADRPRAAREQPAARRPERQSHAGHRRLTARPGHRDRAGADRRRRAGRRARRRERRARRHRRDPVRRRHLRQPQRGRRRQRGAGRRASGQGQGAGAGRRSCSRRAAADLEFADGGVQVRGAPGRRLTLGSLRRRPRRASRCPRA